MPSLSSVLVRCLMWLHYVYLLALPMLSVWAAATFGRSDDFKAMLIVFGSLPVMGYAVFLATGYRVPNSLPVALLVVLAVPAQIAFGVLVFGNRSLWVFFAESATVEVGAFLPAMLVAIWCERSDARGCLRFLIPAGLGGVTPFFLLVVDGYGGVSLWLLPFVTAYVTAFRGYLRLYKKVIRAYQASGEEQEVELRVDGGWLFRKLSSDKAIELLSPFGQLRAANAIAWRPVVCGLLSFLLFLTAAGTGKLLNWH